MTTQVEPAVVDLPLPLPGDVVLSTTEVELEVVVAEQQGQYGPALTLPIGTPIQVKITRCDLARWTGAEWIFHALVAGSSDPFWIRATVKPNEWSEVDSL